MPKIELTKDELELIFECIVQSVCHDDDLLFEYRNTHNMTDDELDEFSIALRERIYHLIKKYEP